MNFHQWVFIAIFPFNSIVCLRCALGKELETRNLVAKYDRSVCSWVYTAFHICFIVLYSKVNVKGIAYHDRRQAAVMVVGVSEWPDEQAGTQPREESSGLHCPSPPAHFHLVLVRLLLLAMYTAGIRCLCPSPPLQQ